MPKPYQIVTPSRQSSTSSSPLVALNTIDPVPSRMPGTTFRSGQARFKYLIGEIVLANVQIPASICDVPFPPSEGFAAEPHNVLSMCPSESNCVVAASWPVGSHIKRLSLFRRNIQYVPFIQRRHYIALSGSFSEYLAGTFSSKARKNLLRTVRLAGAAGCVMTIHESETEMDTFLRDAVALSQTTYQSRMLGVGLPASTQFRDAVLSRAREGTTRGYMLHAYGKTVAFAYCTCQDATLYYSTIGYDAQYASLSPGIVLLYHLLEHVFAENRFKYVDFGVGEAQYKSLFGTHTGTTCDIYFLPATVKNVSMILAHAAVITASSTLGRIAERTGLKPTVRKWVRRARGL